MNSRPIETLTIDDIPTLRNIPVYAGDGEEIGHVGDVYYDEAAGRVECVGIAGDAVGFRRVMVPVQGATLADDGLHLGYGRDRLDTSPEFDDDDFDDERYAELRRHYDDEGSVTRSEEELAVGKREVDAGSARLRKWVETEPVSVDVQLQRETARVTREQLDEPVGDHDFQEEEIEVPMHAERPVVQKQAVAKERVGIEKDVTTETKTVTDEVRKERVEVEGDEAPR